MAAPFKLGIVRDVRARSPITVNTQIERAHCRPWGLAGGFDGIGNRVDMRLDGVWKTDFPNAKVLVAHLKEGDAFRIQSGGGGGYGWPKERSAEQVGGPDERGVSVVTVAVDGGILHRLAGLPAGVPTCRALGQPVEA